ncbi:NfeD family protein [Virgibacillus sp. JSM 102003]|uniref:NfeD family protein n=1 Tax=Virgibacillus sp. JSM 102003 TaxID=1562108 RepID=UPI0035C03B00
MDIFALDWIGFVITGFGTLFLIGEMLVNMRGFFGLIGLGFITVYFAVYLETGSFIIMLIVYLIGLLLIIIDGKIINDGTLATIGLACMLTAVALTAPNLYAGMYAVIGVLLGGFSSLFFLKVFKRRDMWSKLTLVDQLTKEAGYNSMNEEYEQLLNEEGKTVSNLRPVGTVQIKNKNYSAISNGQWIPKNTYIKVVDVDGTRILVEKINRA